MIIKTNKNKILKISIITKKEVPATTYDVFIYFSKYIKDRNIKIKEELPFLLNDRIIFNHEEVLSELSLFEIYRIKLSTYDKLKYLDNLNSKRKR